MNGRTFSQNPRKRGKSHHLYVCVVCLSVSVWVGARKSTKSMDGRVLCHVTDYTYLQKYGTVLPGGGG